MGLYNRLTAPVRCPRCLEHVAATIECKFGYRAELMELRIGDRYPWRDTPVPPVDSEQVHRMAAASRDTPPRVWRWLTRAAKEQARPQNGTCEGPGYAACPSCDGD